MSLTALLSLTVSTACSDDAPGAMETPAATVLPQAVPNGDFEGGLDGWTVEGDHASVAVSNDGCDGTKALRLTGDAVVKRTITGLENGTYVLVYYAKNEGGQTTCAITANGRKASPRVSASSWIKGYVRGIEVTGGSVELSLALGGTSGAASEFDGLKLIRNDKPYSMLTGGDISFLNYVEKNGGKFRDAAGNEVDCVEFLKSQGVNVVRLRLYNDPGFEGDEWSAKMPKGVQDEQDILSLARRAKAAGMQIVLTFHYSDCWTNGEDQVIPHEWRDLGYEELKVKVHDFTASFLKKMNDQGTAPEFVAIGNEIQAGLLYPIGSCDKPEQMCGLLNAASRAVRETTPDARVIVHLAGAGDRDTNAWYLSMLRDWHVDYDVIGSSYYPFWTGRWASDVCNWAADVTQAFDKDLIFMEVGYAWNATLPDGSVGQIANNDPYGDMTKRGQKDFMLDLTHRINEVDNQRVLGYLYWDPIYIEVPGLGWIVGQKNVVSNTTWFGFDGAALEVFDAIRNNN